MNVYIISLAQGSVSAQLIPYQIKAQHDLNTALSFCNHYGVNPEVFPAVDGYNINNQTWRKYNLIPPERSTKKDDAFGNLPGAQGCFLSHFTLWQKCLEIQEPIVVLEDDAQVIATFNVVSNKDVVKLQKPNNVKLNKHVGNWSAGAYGYWLTPTGANKLINFSILHGPKHADKILGSYVVDWEFSSTPMVKLGPRSESSTNPIKYPLKSVSRV